MTHSVINIDIETRSKVDLFTAGGDKYCSDPSTKILCYSYKIDDQPVRSVRGDAPTPVPYELAHAILEGATVRGWNIAGFDVPLWNNLHPQCPIKPEQIDDTMDRARVYGMPGMLKNAARFMGLKLRKDMDGHKLMMKVCKSQNPYPTEEELVRLAAYCDKDVEVEAGLASLIPPLPEFEKRVAALSHKINRRGFMVDLDMAERAVIFAEAEREEMSARLTELTDGVVDRHTQRARIFNFLNERGCKLPNLQKQTLEVAMEHEHDPLLKEIMDIRLSGAKASTAKFLSAVNMAGDDHRVRGSLVYFGANATGRWSGRGIQPHNLPRLTAKDPAEVLANLEKGNVGSVYKSLSSLLRPMIMAPEGKSLVRCDYSAIEGRVVAWLANDLDTLKEYRGAGKMYEKAAAAVYRVPAHTIKNPSPERQVGKTCELSLVFQGGHVPFQAMGKNFGVHVPEAEAKAIVKAWRKSRPAVVALWKEVENAAELAYLKKSRVMCCGGKVAFVFDPALKNMWIQLPAGRFICLPDFKVAYSEGPYGTQTDMSYKRGSWTPKAGDTEWPRSSIYGGSFVESLAQGIARDLLAESMLVLDNAKLDIVMHVHDEVVIECTDAFAPDVLTRVEHEMSIAPPWAEGLPLAAVGKISKRFGK